MQRRSIVRLFFLGTGAAEGYPAPFCHCENCELARQRGGRSLRLRSSLLVNDNLLIDCNDIVAACALYGANLDKVTTMLMTHSHTDHLDPVEMSWRAYPFAKTPVPTMAVLGPWDATARMEAMWGRQNEHHRLWMADVRHGVRIWRDGYTITPLAANHGTAYPTIYAIDDGKRSILYSTDTGRYPEATWERIKTLKFDAVIIDETMGYGPSGGHMNAEDVIYYREAFEAEGLLKPGALFIAQHFSHGYNPPYEELCELFGPHDIAVAYDGWKLEI